MRLVSSPNGSIFDQRAHICAEVFVIKFSLSAILLFERKVYLLLYESLWLYVYTLLTFYSIKKQSRTRFLAKLQTYILHDKMQNALFVGVHLEPAQKQSGESPGTSEWLWCVFRTLCDLLRPTQKANKKIHFFRPPTQPL